MAIEKIVNPAQAAGAYANTATQKKPAGEGADFANILRKTAENVVDSVRGGEKATAEAIIGGKDVNDVVRAVTEAEMTLRTVVAVRDRLVSAYQEIMRMPI